MLVNIYDRGREGYARLLTRDRGRGGYARLLTYMIAGAALCSVTNL